MAEEIIIAHDGEFDIAIGKGRNELSWKNKVWSWSDFLNKIKDTQYTHETYLEYKHLKRERQEEIKDIGGFVGGYLANGRKKAGNVMHRQVLTLDIDHMAPSLFGEFWDDFTMIYGNAACIYSTHKHSKETPRYRLIMPLDRPVGPDEYEAIGRRIGGNLGIEDFDHTGFQPSRMMFWPSTSKDGVYEFHYQDGLWLNADKILASYVNWKDVNDWPVSQRYHSVLVNAMKKQGDPLEKPGVIGAFCRTYTIDEVIDKFLADKYEPCDVEGRYTYKEGSTSAGLVVYEDKYTYSHHGTDPTSMRLCNAFDLVRMHLFLADDDGVSEDMPINKRPSFLNMTDFAVKDVEVRKRLGAERLANARDEFDGVWTEGESGTAEFSETADLELPEDMDWIATLEVDRKGNYYATLDNIVILLENDPRLKKRLTFDRFELRETVKGDLPWRKTSGYESAYFSDTDVANLKHYVEKVYKIPCGPKIEDALKIIYSRHSYHPVRDYLNKLKWDGIPRAERVLIDYLGCADTEYTRTITRKWLAAAVTRVFKPGCKFDYMIVLIGKQGLKKSMLPDKLAMGWFSDSFTTVQGKEAWEQLQGSWLIEVAELSGMRKSDVETIKHFISKRKDKYRVAYGRRVEEFPRQCIFIGTTNDVTPLKDQTANRRFWPAVVHINIPTKDVGNITQNEIDQVWAEAIEYYKSHEPLYLTPEMDAAAEEVQNQHVERDERAGIVEQYLNTPLASTWASMGMADRRNWLRNYDELQDRGTVVRESVCALEIWCECFGGMQKDMKMQDTKDIHTIMRNMANWNVMKQKVRFGHYGTVVGYSRTNTAEAQQELDNRKCSEFND